MYKHFYIQIMYRGEVSNWHIYGVAEKVEARIRTLTQQGKVVSPVQIMEYNSGLHNTISRGTYERKDAGNGAYWEKYVVFEVVKEEGK